ncbi:hypothetical protein CF326_g2168 [Tilletia indica]|uniref:Uncharacterized protein n=1 Tax=Tilletia indica TaxID=43049 RepID=A0A177TUN2_9BASI|nr:hypothetical protein CF326_g2168 [Tilletia indica]KAE8257251.1 hypothetical protein A4X13_0g2479 [Tilletia indica]
MADSGSGSPTRLAVSDTLTAARAQLPPEILSAIFQHLDPHTLFTSVRALSRQWRKEVETSLLPSQFASGRWKVGLRIASAAASENAVPRPVHASGTSERAVMEAQIEAANAAVLDNPDLAIARLRDMLNTPGTLESQLPLPGPRPPSIVTIPLSFVEYDRTTASLRFTSDAWHAITNSSRNRSELLGCTFHIVWNEAGKNNLETAKPDPQNYWLTKFYLSQGDSSAIAPEAIAHDGYDSPIPTKLVATPLAPRVLAARNTTASADESSPQLAASQTAAPSTTAAQSRLAPPNISASSAAEPPAGPLDWSDASQQYLHLRTLALGIEFFTRPSARANLLTRKLEAERERRLRGESSDEDEDDDEEEEEESDSDEEVEALQSQCEKGHDSLSSSISSLSLSRHSSALKLNDLEKAAAGVTSASYQPSKSNSNSASGSGSGATTAYRTAIQSASHSGTSTPIRLNGNAVPNLKPPTYADFARAAAKGAQNKHNSGPIRPAAMRAPGVAGSPRASKMLGSPHSPAGGSSQLRKEVDLGKGKAKLLTPFSTPFSGTPFPPSSPVPSRPGTPGPASGKGKGQQSTKEIQRAENGSSSTLAMGSTLRNQSNTTQTSSSTPLRSGATSSGPPSLAPPGTPEPLRLGPRVPRAHFHAVVLPAEHFSPNGSAASSPRLGPSAAPSNGNLTSPIARSSSLGGSARRPAPNGNGSATPSGSGNGGRSTGSGSGIGMPPASFFAAKRAATRGTWDERLVGQAEAEFRRSKREQEESSERASGSAETPDSGEGETGPSRATTEVPSSLDTNAGRSSTLRDHEQDDDPDVNHGSVWRSGDVYARGQWRHADRVPGEDATTPDQNGSMGAADNEAEGEQNGDGTDEGGQAAAADDVPSGIQWTWTR